MVIICQKKISFTVKIGIQKKFTMRTAAQFLTKFSRGIPNLFRKIKIKMTKITSQKRSGGALLLSISFGSP